MRVVLLLVVVVVVGVLIRATLFSGGEETPIVAEVSAPASEEVSEPASEEVSEPASEEVSEPASEEIAEETMVAEPKEPPASDETQPEPAPDLIAPKFDVVRVDKQGNAVVAGVASPNSTVQVLGNGAEVARAQTDGSGNFVALFDIPAGQPPLVLELVADPDGAQIKSAESFTILPIDPTHKTAPLIVAKDDEGVTLLQAEPIAPSATDSVTEIQIDTIDYGATGDVIIKGRANADGRVRVSIKDGTPIESPITDGAWQVSLPDVAVGEHALLVEALDETNTITATIDSTLNRALPQTADGNRQVTIQAGDHLWALAYESYGDGLRYLQIFEANKELIQNPDLIFPGQIFNIPQIDTPTTE